MAKLKDFGVGDVVKVQRAKDVSWSWVLKKDELATVIGIEGSCVVLHDDEWYKPKNLKLVHKFKKAPLAYKDVKDSSFTKNKQRFVSFDGVSVRLWTMPTHEGTQRACHKCNYIDEEGREYVIKAAMHQSGVVTNKMEYQVYQFARNGKHSEHMPVFKSISVCGKYLLVEKCVSWSDIEEDGSDAEYVDALTYAEAEGGYDMGDDLGCLLFPAFMHNDLHGGNWGYTLTDKRPVMFDLGISDSCFQSLGSATKMPQSIIDVVMEEEV